VEVPPPCSVLILSTGRIFDRIDKRLPNEVSIAARFTRKVIKPQGLAVKLVGGSPHEAGDRNRSLGVRFGDLALPSTLFEGVNSLDAWASFSQSRQRGTGEATV
jgi:hypothetical protein